MGGWPRGHRRSADINEIGFSGPFFTPRREIAMRRQEMERRRQPASAARKSGRLSSSPAHSPGRGSYQTRSGAVARPARRAPAAGGCARARGLRFRLPGREAISVWAATCPGRRGGARLSCHRPPRRKPGRPAGHLLAAEQPLCRRTSPVPTGRAGMQGRAASLPRRDRLGAARLVRFRPSQWPSPVPRGPAYPPGRIGAGAYRSPCTSRVPAVDLSGTWPRNGRPAADLTPPGPGPAGPGQDQDAVRPGQVTAGSASGQRQVCARSAGGRPGGHRRSAPGQWRLAAWACAPVRYP